MDETFSVYQFFVDGSQEKVLENVPAEQAVQKVKDLLQTIGAKIGTTERIIITDGWDLCNLEWIFGKGIVFPKQEDIHGTQGKQPTGTTQTRKQARGQPTCQSTYTHGSS